MIVFNKRLLFAPILILLLTVSCKDDESGKDFKPEYGLSTNCPFEQNDSDNDGSIDDNEMEAMTDCWNNRLTTKSEIEANLIGDWILVGYGTGWTYTPSQPCANLTFTTESLTLDFENQWIDIISTSSWNIAEAQPGWFHIDAPDLEEGAYAVRLSTFCERFMYINDTPLDGNMYIYQKVD